MNMKRFNKDDLIKIVILSGFALFFGKIIITGEIKNYVHPRIIPCVYFALAGFAVMIILEIRKLLCEAEVQFQFQVKKYAVFFAVLILIFYMEFNNIGNSNASSGAISYKSADMNSLSWTNNSSENKQADVASSKSYNNDRQSDSDSIDNIELEENDGVIKIERENYVCSLNEILGSPEKYDGRKVEISGFVYLESSLKENEFVIGRYMMVCCAADLQVAGIKCISDNGDELSRSSGTWIKVQGTIADIDNEAVIKADSIAVDENPDKQYVYPF